LVYFGSCVGARGRSEGNCLRCFQSFPIKFDLYALRGLKYLRHLPKAVNLMTVEKIKSHDEEMNHLRNRETGIEKERDPRTAVEIEIEKKTAAAEEAAAAAATESQESDQVQSIKFAFSIVPSVIPCQVPVGTSQT
jgi:hypothetical protein